MFGKRKTENKKMRIWVEFANALHTSDFQCRLSKVLDFYMVKKTETFTYKFTIMEYEYPIFMATLNEHWDNFLPRSACLTNIVKIK